MQCVKKIYGANVHCFPSLFLISIVDLLIELLTT